MTQAHNATLTVSNEEITVMRSELSAALYRGSQSRTVSTIAISEITSLSATEPTALNCGSVRLSGTGEEIIFSPGDNGRKALQANTPMAKLARRNLSPPQNSPSIYSPQARLPTAPARSSHTMGSRTLHCYTEHSWTPLAVPRNSPTAARSRSPARPARGQSLLFATTIWPP